MIISFKHRATFLAVPRTASRSVYQWLVDSADEEETKVFGGYHGRDLPSEFANWFSFATVRHPYTRAVSFWMHAINVGPIRKAQIEAGETLDILYTRCGGDQSFDSFVQWLVKKRPDDPLEWHNQSSFIHGIKLDQLLYFERLEKDFHKLPFVNKKDQLSTIGKQLGNNDWTKYYSNSETLVALRRWAEPDFDNFNYCPRYHITGKPFKS